MRAKRYIVSQLSPLLDEIIGQRINASSFQHLAPGFFRQLFGEAGQIAKMIATEMRDHSGSYLPYRAGEKTFAINNDALDSLGMCQLNLPIPPRDLWLHYGTTSEEYLDGGKKSTEDMLNILGDCRFTLQDGYRVLDFGCGAGRMLRWLKPMAHRLELWGVDIGAEHIVWCQHHLSPPFHFAVSTTTPHLPFQDGYFDLIYSGSVFTHIDDLAKTWLLELARILRSKGLAYITIHDKHTVDLFKGSWEHHIFARQMTGNPKFCEYTENDFAVFTINRSVNSHVFYDRDYFCRLALPLLRPVEVREEAYAYQTAIVFERRG